MHLELIDIITVNNIIIITLHIVSIIFSIFTIIFSIVSIIFNVLVKLTVLVVSSIAKFKHFL